MVVAPQEETAVDTQLYLGGLPITRYRFERAIEVRDAQSGDVLWTHTLRGTEPAPFPEVAPRDQTRINGGPVGFLEVLLYLQERLCKFPAQCPSPATLLEQPPNAYEVIGLSPDSQILAISDRVLETSGGYATQYSVVHLWQVINGKLLHHLRHENPPLVQIAFSPDGEFLATLSEDGKIWLWQVADGRLLRTLEGEHFILFSPDAQMLAAAGSDGIQIWRVADWTPLRTLPQKVFPYDEPYAAFSPDSQYLAVMTPSELQLWRLSDGKSLLLSMPLESDSAVGGFAFSPDSQVLAEVNSGEARLWQTTDGRLLRKWDLGFGGGRAGRIRFSPDGQFIAVSLPGDYSTADKVQLWRASDGHHLHTLDGHRVIFSPDSQYMALFSASEIKVLRVADGALVHTLTRDTEFLLNDRLAVFMDGERLGVCHVDLWSSAATK